MNSDKGVDQDEVAADVMTQGGQMRVKQGHTQQPNPYRWRHIGGKSAQTVTSTGWQLIAACLLAASLGAVVTGALAVSEYLLAIGILLLLAVALGDWWERQ